MCRVISAIILAIYWPGMVLADEPQTGDEFRTARERAATNSIPNKSSTDEIFRTAREPSKLNLDTSPTKQVSKQTFQGETFTVYESKVFPGFRPCTPEDYRNQRYDPIACQDYDASRMMSTRDHDQQSRELITENVVVPEAVVPQGNIYQLRFERFKRKKK